MARRIEVWLGPERGGRAEIWLGRSVATLRMRNRTSQSLFRPRLSRQPLGPGRPASATAPHFPRWGSVTRRLPPMARRRVGCACIGPSRLRDLSAPLPLWPYARTYAFRGLRAFASLSLARSERRRDRSHWGGGSGVRAGSPGRLRQGIRPNPSNLIRAR
mgnify:FL=1